MWKQLPWNLHGIQHPFRAPGTQSSQKEPVHCLNQKLGGQSKTVTASEVIHHHGRIWKKRDKQSSGYLEPSDSHFIVWVIIWTKGWKHMITSGKSTQLCLLCIVAVMCTHSSWDRVRGACWTVSGNIGIEYCFWCLLDSQEYSEIP